jgi:hypothetical protein
LKNATDAPPFAFAQRSGFSNFDEVADLAGIFLIVRHEFIPPANVFFVQWMPNQPFNLNHYGFIHLVADYNAVDLSFHSTCFHKRP